MRFKALFIGLLSISLIGCVPDPKDSTNTNNTSTVDPNVVTVNLDLSNFERYIKCTRHEGFTGVAGWSSYEAWYEFEGLLSIGVYDVTVIYYADNSSHNLKLDVSGGGKSDYFDRNLDSSITKVSGTVTYRI